MSLFGAPMTKGITEKELTYVRGELMSGHSGHPETKFTSMEVDRVMDILTMALDPDSLAERQHHQGIIDANEAQSAENNLANNLSEPKRTFLHQVLQKYVDQNIVHGLFS